MNSEKLAREVKIYSEDMSEFFTNNRYTQDINLKIWDY